MAVGAQLTVTDMRRAARHPVDYPVIGEHRRLGDVHLHVVNLSAHGFMVEHATTFNKVLLEFLGRVTALQHAAATAPEEK